MPITRLNHAVLFVSDLTASADFYQRVLEFTPVNMTPEGFSGALFLRAAGSSNDHDLGLFETGAGTRQEGGGVGLYHLAWEVNTLAELDRIRTALQDAGALVGSSDHGTTKSVYGKDPDSIEFEIMWLVPFDRIDEATLHARRTIAPLDLEREIERHGADTLGGAAVAG